MDKKEEQLHTQVMEALLDYLEGKKTLRSVLVLGINAYHTIPVPEKEAFYDVISELNSMANEIGNGENRKYSREKVKETFTTMLEKLTKN